MAEAKWATDERRLAAAYDDISAGRYKSASSTVERHLKKHPGSQPGLVLRMVLLERIESPEEDVLQAVEPIRKTGTLTTRAAWWIGVTMRNLGRPDLALELYQELWKHLSDNVDLGEQVFVHAAAAWDTGVMVESSRKMFNKLRAPVWARVAAWSEWVKHASHPTHQDGFTAAPSKTMLVSTTLLSTTRKQCESPDILWLHLQIMISAGALKDAVELAQSVGSEGSLTRMWYRMEGVKEASRRMKGKGEDTTTSWKMEWEWVKEKLRDTECQRNYAFYRYFLLVTMELLPTHSNIAKDTLETLRSLNEEIGAKERAPRLALLELDTKLKCADHALALSLDKWTESVQEYWAKWGSKGSIVSELGGLVEGDEAKETEIKAIFAGEKRVHSSLSEYRRCVNSELWLLRHQKSTCEWGSEYLNGLYQLFAGGVQYGANLPSTDIQPNDDIGLAIVHLLLVRWSEKRDEGLLVLAIGTLRMIVKRSTSCKAASLLLARALRIAGASGCSECSDEIAAKNWSEIQLDNLAHVAHERAGIEAYVNHQKDQWMLFDKFAGKMYRRTSTDMPDYIKQALQNESYSKIPGIRTLASQLNSSLSHALTTVESTRLAVAAGELISVASTKTLRRVASGEELVDTRDWSLVPELGPNRGSLREALKLGNEPSPTYARTWARMLVLAGTLDQADDTDLGDLDLANAECLPAERVMISAAMSLLKRTKATMTASDPVEVESIEISETFTELLASTKSSDEGSWWNRLYPYYLVIELRSILNLVICTLTASSKPGGKKAQKSSPSVSILLNQVQVLRTDLQTKLAEIYAALEELKAMAAKLELAAIEQYQLNDVDLEETRDVIVDARVTGIERIVAVLKEGK